IPGEPTAAVSAAAARSAKAAPQDRGNDLAEKAAGRADEARAAAHAAGATRL
ncbi:hypothetical protein GT002_12520, partial [Streptomyces sp. SID4917]